MTKSKAQDEEFGIAHDSSKQCLRMGTTVGGKCLFVEFTVRGGESGSEYLTRHETGELIEWLMLKHHGLAE